MAHRTVKNPDELALLKVYLEGLKRPFSVDITEGRDRSQEQSRLSFKWYAEIADQTGEDREDARARCKLMFGIPILRRQKPKFKIVYDRTLLPLDYAQKLEFIRDTEMQVTSLMNVGQMTGYLDAVFKYHAERGIELTIPPDRYAFDPERRAAA